MSRNDQMIFINENFSSIVAASLLLVRVYRLPDVQRQVSRPREVSAHGVFMVVGRLGSCWLGHLFLLLGYFRFYITWTVRAFCKPIAQLFLQGSASIVQGQGTTIVPLSCANLLPAFHRNMGKLAHFVRAIFAGLSAYPAIIVICPNREFLSVNCSTFL